MIHRSSWNDEGNRKMSLSRKYLFVYVSVNTSSLIPAKTLFLEDTFGLLELSPDGVWA